MIISRLALSRFYASTLERRSGPNWSKLVEIWSEEAQNETTTTKTTPNCKFALHLQTAPSSQQAATAAAHDFEAPSLLGVWEHRVAPDISPRSQRAGNDSQRVVATLKKKTKSQRAGSTKKKSLLVNILFHFISRASSYSSSSMATPHR